MIEETAVVTAIQDGHAVLELERRTACSLCGQKRGCGNATWGKLLGHHRKAFTASNTIDLAVGESVVVGFDERVLLNTTLLLYGMPLICLLVATLIADSFFSNQLYVALSALLGLALSLLITSYIVSKKNTGIPVLNNHTHAVIMRRADRA